MLFEILSLLLRLLFICKFFISWKNGPSIRLPPGPKPYPILGNLPQITRAHPTHGYLAFHKLSLEYGDVMCLRVGFQNIVVLSSYNVMKELLAKEEFSGRHWEGFLKDRSMGKEIGVSFSSGDKQKVLKNFTIKKLREFGFGRRATMESIILLELEEVKRSLMSSIQNNNGLVLMERYFQLGLLNVLWTMLAGVRYSHDDPKLLHLMEVNSVWFQSPNFGSGIVTAYPTLRYIFPGWTGRNAQRVGNQIIYDYLREIIKEHRGRPGYDSDPQSFVDVFLTEIDKNFGKTGTCFTDEEFMVTCYDIFQAGFETTGQTLAFGILYMIHNPTIQKKVQAEIDSVLPRNVKPIMEHRDKLPYTRATIFEILRLSDIIPIPGPRKAMEDYHFKDYVIPKDTAVAFNTYSVMRDQEVWGDPDNFRPERFLDSNGELNGKQDYIGMIFGYGRRSCLGESLAQTTSFMYFTTLLQNFNFEPDPEELTLPCLDPVFGIILSPQPYEVKVTLRE